MIAIPKVPNWKKVDARVVNQLIDRVNVLSKVTASNGIVATVSSLGINLRGSGAGAGVGTRLRIFEVQAAASGDGIYNCYEQTLDATEFGDTAGDDKFDDKDPAWSGAVGYTVGMIVTIAYVRYRCVTAHTNQQPPNATFWAVDDIKVLNLYENDPVTGAGALDYEPALGLYDRLACWQWSDDEGNSRWVGTPLTPQIRIVFAAENAPGTDVDTTSVTCNLMLNHSVEAVSGQLGYNIEVFGTCVGGTANWNAVVPRIANTDKLMAQCVNGRWGFPDSFMPAEDCGCS